MGKTSIAVQYACQAKKRYASIIWLDADTEEFLEDSARVAVESIARYYHRNSDLDYLDDLWTSRGMPVSTVSGLLQEMEQTPGVPKSSVMRYALKKWLKEEGNSRWLIILDNMDDWETSWGRDMRDSLEGGHVLITTRLKNPDPSRTTIELTKPDIDDAKELLYSAIWGKDHDIKRESHSMKGMSNSQLVCRFPFY